MLNTNKAAFSVKYYRVCISLLKQKANFKFSRTFNQAFVIDFIFLFDNNNLIRKLLKDFWKFEIGLEKHRCANKASFSVKSYRVCIGLAVRASLENRKFVQNFRQINDWTWGLWSWPKICSKYRKHWKLKLHAVSDFKERSSGPSQGLKIRLGGLVILGGDNVPPHLRRAWSYKERC